MSKKKIAFVSPRYPDPKGNAVGGAETLQKKLAEYLAQQGYEVDFLTTCARNHFSWENDVPPGQEVINGVRIEYFEVNEDRDVETFLRIQEPLSNGEKISIEDQRAWMANSVHSDTLYDHVLNTDYDAILTGPYLFGLSFKGGQLKPEKTFLIPCLHDEVFAYLDIMHELFHNVHHIIFNAKAEKELAMRLYGIPTEKGSVVGMGMEAFDPAPEGSFHKRINIHKPYVYYCGRREGLKGTQLMMAYLEAFWERTGKEVLLVSSGTGAINTSHEHAERVIDLGFISEEAKQMAMSNAVAFIHPSTNESFGIVLLEAFLGETPGLVHAGSEVLKGHCRDAQAGLWFNNYPEFEEMLLRLLEDQELNKALGKNGRNYVLAQYSWESVGHTLMTALEQ